MFYFGGKEKVSLCYIFTQRDRMRINKLNTSLRIQGFAELRNWNKKSASVEQGKFREIPQLPVKSFSGTTPLVVSVFLSQKGTPPVPASRPNRKSGRSVP